MLGNDGVWYARDPESGQWLPADEYDRRLRAKKEWDDWQADQQREWDDWAGAEEGSIREGRGQHLHEGTGPSTQRRHIAQTQNVNNYLLTNLLCGVTKLSMSVVPTMAWEWGKCGEWGNTLLLLGGEWGNQSRFTLLLPGGEWGKGGWGKGGWGKGGWGEDGWDEDGGWGGDGYDGDDDEEPYIGIHQTGDKEMAALGTMGDLMYDSYLGDGKKQKKFEKDMEKRNKANDNFKKKKPAG